MQPLTGVSAEHLLSYDSEKYGEDATKSPLSSNAADEEFDKGGPQAWLTVLGAALVQFTTFGYINAFGVYQDFYVREYLTNYTSSQIGWIGGVQLFFNFALGLVAGGLFDRGYYYHLMGCGGVLLSLALFMLSLSHENSYYQVFLSHGVCFGIACGLVFTPALSISGHYFRQKRPLAMGLVSAGSALGAVIHPIMLNKLFSGKIGFHNGVRISAGMNTVLFILAIAMMRTRMPPKQGPPPGPIIKRFMCHKPYVLSIIACMFIFLGLFFPIFYLQLKAALTGVDQNLAFYSIAILNAGSFVGRALPGLVAPLVGVTNLMLFCCFGTGAVCMCMISVENPTSTVIFAVAYGFFAGAVTALTPAVIAVMSFDMNEIGMRIGIFYAFSSIIALFATSLAGALLGQTYRWTTAIVFSGSAIFAGAVLFVGVRHLIAREKGKSVLSLM